jgi:diguanylate cyclase (GGDEF)-like protein
VTPSSFRRAARPLLLALLASFYALRASGFPTEPSPAVVQPAPPPLPAGPDRWLPFRVFDWREKLGSYVSALRPDKEGYLWAASADGLKIYNGRTWLLVPPPSTEVPGLFTDLLVASDGGLWVAGSSGASRLQDGRWTSWTESTGLAGNTVNALEEAAGAIWIGTSRGLSRCQGDTCHPIPAVREVSVRSLLPARAEDGRPALWVGTSRGLVRLDEIAGPQPRLAPLLFDHRNALPDYSVLSLGESFSPDGAPSLWVGTENGLARLRAGVWTRYDAATAFPARKVTAFLASRWAGRPVVWVGSLGTGLIRIEEDGRWQSFGTTAGLPSKNVVDLLATGADPENPALWVATLDGLARLERDRWHSFGSQTGLPEDAVVGAGEALFPDGLDSFWVTTSNGMYRLTARGWERYEPIQEAIFFVASTREEGEPVFWIAAMDGLHRWSRGRRDHFTTRNSALPHDWAASLLAIPEELGGGLWAQSQAGLAHWAEGRWTAYPSGSSGLPGPSPSRLTWSPNGHGGADAWVGTTTGVFRFSAGRWGLVELPCLPSPVVHSVEAADLDARGNGWLWIGTLRGVARVRLQAGQTVPQTCQSLSAATQPALPQPQIDQIEIDRLGRIYLCSSSGVTRLSLPPGAGSLREAGLETFDSEDGLSGFQLTGVSFRDRLGRIWIGAASGLSVFDPDLAPRSVSPEPPAPLRIERLLVDGRERPPASGLVLQHRERRLEIDFALLRFRREHATRFRTQLAGLEEHPSSWTREVRVTYDRLPPGRYTFRVWGRDGDGVVSGPAELGFRVLPPPWLTRWAFALYALALAGLVYGAVRLRVRTLARQAAQLEAIVAERTRDLAEANRRLERASFTDPLTGLGNRRFLTSTIRADVVQAVRNHREPMGDPHHRDLIVYLLDLDHFKRLNDRAGHDAGDAVLVETARRLREVARASDLVVRWGGEEILIVSRWTDRGTGALLAERVLEAIGGHLFRTGTDRTSTVTCSIGWAPFPWSTDDPNAVLFEEVLSLADHALYMAKRAGRNRSVGVLPGATTAEEVAERILREDAPIHTLEGLGVELIWSEGPKVATEDRTATTARRA